MNIETYGKIRLVNADCMEVMRGMPDNAFDLAICDPPYGLGIDGQKECLCKNPKHNRKQHDKKGWDKLPPPRVLHGASKGKQEPNHLGGLTTLYNTCQKARKVGYVGSKGKPG